MSVTEIVPQNGVLDLRNIDVSDRVFNVANRWDFYPGALYTSEDFSAGKTGEKAAPEVSASDSAFGTYRLQILAQPNCYYAICGFSLDYASLVFVNGAEVAAFGNVAETKEDFVPKVGYMTIPMFSGPDGEIEVIYQYANYVHREGGYIQPTFLSTPQNIEEFKEADNLVSLTISGGLLLMALYFLLSAVARRKAYFLCLVFCCFLTALRDQNFLNIHLLGSDVSWYFAYRTLILIVMLLPVSILLLLKCQYKRESKQWPLYLYLGIAVVAGILICVLPTQDLTTVSAAVYYLSAPYLIYLIYGIVRHYMKQRRLKTMDILALSGFFVLLTGMLYEALMTGHSSEVTRYGATAYGMLGFVFLNAVAINLQMQKREVELLASRSRNEMLEKMNHLNMEFLHKVGHELKTPLTVISGYAQLTGMQMTVGGTNDGASKNLKIIQQEAQRLANIVTRLMDYSYGRKTEPDFERIEVPELLRNVHAIAVPLCIKNRNAVKLSTVYDGAVHGNFEMLLQIFINLIINANKNTENGCITISASDEEQDDMILFRVQDTGRGISAEDLPHIFQEGYSANGGSGLGLTICKEVVEAHGGRIWVEQTGPDGTVFAFTVFREVESK